VEPDFTEPFRELLAPLFRALEDVEDFFLAVAPGPAAHVRPSIPSIIAQANNRIMATPV
jgi:hypothetical protein